MSGGSMNYLYRRLLWESEFEDSTELRREFRLHLIQVAAALKAIEWVDSGDLSPGDEDEALAVVLGSRKPINYFRVQEIAINRGLDYNKFGAAMRDYLGLE